MGITEVIRHMPRIYGEYRKLKRSLQSQPNLPDAAVLIDFPDVNLGLARELHRLRIPVIFFVSPQLWAWKKHRIHQVSVMWTECWSSFRSRRSFIRATASRQPLSAIRSRICRRRRSPELSWPLRITWTRRSRGSRLLPGSRQKGDRSEPANDAGSRNPARRRCGVPAAARSDAEPRIQDKSGRDHQVRRAAQSPSFMMLAPLSSMPASASSPAGQQPSRQR